MGERRKDLDLVVVRRARKGGEFWSEVFLVASLCSEQSSSVLLTQPLPWQRTLLFRGTSQHQTPTLPQGGDLMAGVDTLNMVRHKQYPRFANLRTPTKEILHFNFMLGHFQSRLNLLGIDLKNLAQRTQKFTKIEGMPAGQSFLQDPTLSSYTKRFGKVFQAVLFHLHVWVDVAKRDGDGRRGWRWTAHYCKNCPPPLVLHRRVFIFIGEEDNMSTTPPTSKQATIPTSISSAAAHRTRRTGIRQPGPRH